MAGSEEDVRRLVETVHDLLNGPGGQRHFDCDLCEKERVVLDIPKAWVVLAAWLTIKARKRGAGDLENSAFMQPDSPDHIDRNVRTWARGHLLFLIDSCMHSELHELATGTHPYLFPEEVRECAAPDLDDGIPF